MSRHVSRLLASSVSLIAFTALGPVETRYAAPDVAAGERREAVPADEDGYDLWLRYRLVTDEVRLQEYRAALRRLHVAGSSPTLEAARDELRRGLGGLLGQEIAEASDVGDGTIVLGTPASSDAVAALDLGAALAETGDEGFIIRTAGVDGRGGIVIAANEEVGVLYGAFHFLRLLQTYAPLGDLDITSTPRIRLRVLNHWDNLNRTVERGYAGFSLWNWHLLPRHLDPRYTDYARANASIGINGTVLNNVNANTLSLTAPYLEKAAALADVFRPYGIRVYLSARFNAPTEIGGLETADPLDPAVQRWWREKADEIVRVVPDFGGFLVKADSEGQPGPHGYGRTHAEGANMLADALAPHGGVVMWRAFVYDADVEVDRVRQAYDEFQPLDGQFRDNVLLQVKNGPLDFQPREPFHPLFGGVPRTPLMLELQITKEYLGQTTHLTYLAPLFKEVLDADTYARGEGSSVARVIDGTLDGHRLTGIAGVANTGTERNWSGSHFNQADWFAFGRLAWDHSLSSEAIAEDWARMTFTNDGAVVAQITGMMLPSREAAVSYMTPLGLHHIMARSHHYGPGPWVEDAPRADWTALYYHRADREGIGFDRSETGSDAVAQYHEPLRSRWGDVKTVPERLLLWFHRVPWDHRMASGLTLWDELALRYQSGVEAVREMQRQWAAIEGAIDRRRYDDVKTFLTIQEREARWWRDACLLYFQTFSGMPLPDGVEEPEHALEHYRTLQHRFVPGI